MSGYPTSSMQFPKPGRALGSVLLLLSGVWALLALGMNYLGMSPGVVEALTLQPDAVATGQVWRLLTSSMIHIWSGPGAVSHLLMSLMGLYFLGPSLEERWGALRMAGFLAGAALVGGLAQSASSLLFPALRAGGTSFGYLGALAMVEGVAVAWALQNRRAQLRLFFVLPMTGAALLAVVVGLSLLHVLTQSGGPEGMGAPFGGMLAGWLLSDESPLRRPYLRWKLRRLNAQTQRLTGGRDARLRVVSGGRTLKSPSKLDIH